MKMYELLAEPEAWRKTYLAADANGDMIWPESEKAIQFSLLGAAIRVYSGSGFRPIVDKLSERLYPYSIYGWNHGTTHAEVIAQGMREAAGICGGWGDGGDAASVAILDRARELEQK